MVHSAIVGLRDRIGWSSNRDSMRLGNTYEAKNQELVILSRFEALASGKTILSRFSPIVQVVSNLNSPLNYYPSYLWI